MPPVRSATADHWLRVRRPYRQLSRRPRTPGAGEEVPGARSGWRAGGTEEPGRILSMTGHDGQSTVVLAEPFLPRASQPAGQHPFLDPGERVLIRRQVLLPRLLVPDLHAV